MKWFSIFVTIFFFIIFFCSDFPPTNYLLENKLISYFDETKNYDGNTKNKPKFNYLEEYRNGE